MMKKTTARLTLLCICLFAGPVFAAQGYEPVDLASMEESGLSPETIGRFLSQNLGSNRQAPPVDANLLSRLGRYGGDSLATAYLDLDRATAHQASRDYSPEVVEQLMTGGTPPAELNKILTDEAARAAADQDEPAPEVSAAASQPLMPPPLPPAPEASEMKFAELPPPPAAPSTPAPLVPSVMIPISPRLPEAPPLPTTCQDLRPGQAADPASRLPVPYSTYDIRNNRQAGDVRRHNPGGPWMGVVEKELPDGHLVEANSIGRTDRVGQEVYTRPSGHEVYRYYTGNPDNPYSGADPYQERRNYEDLRVIFSERARY